MYLELLSQLNRYVSEKEIQRVQCRFIKPDENRLAIIFKAPQNSLIGVIQYGKRKVKYKSN
jgi:hypothetical protein